MAKKYEDDWELISDLKGMCKYFLLNASYIPEDIQLEIANSYDKIFNLFYKAEENEKELNKTKKEISE